ncbi:MAG TPA: TetR family transcriptional regulator [Solirubrobacteraceae bacterium]|nr:TetR family transcriptional regulator [Solirubrobacteraceae bacterium]
MRASASVTTDPQAPAAAAAATGPAAATPYREAARELLRDSLFDAARRLLEDRPWAQITMAEIARAAGVSRQTLYAQFGSRDDFAQQFVIREGARFLEDVEQAIHAHLDDPVRAVSAAMEAFLVAATEDPLVSLLLADDGTGGMLPLVTTRSRPVLDWASARLCVAMRDGWPAIADADAELLGDTFVRLALSYVTMPRLDSPRATAEAAADLLGPYVERAVASAGS